jgi:phage tail protein X
MATIYRTRDGDVLDDICYSHYGTEQAVIQVLNANSGLSELGGVYHAGVDIVLPDIELPKEESEASLWD